MEIVFGTFAFLIGSALLVYRNGLRRGVSQTGVVTALLAFYLAAIYFFGQDGKVWFAILIVTMAVGVIFYRKRKGQKIW